MVCSTPFAVSVASLVEHQLLCSTRARYLKGAKVDAVLLCWLKRRDLCHTHGMRSRDAPSLKRGVLREIPIGTRTVLALTATALIGVKGHQMRSSNGADARQQAASAETDGRMDLLR